MQGVFIIDRNDESVHFVLQEVWNPIAIRGDHWPLRCHCLQHDVGQSFPQTAEYEQVDRLIQVARIRKKSTEPHMLLQLQLINLTLQLITQVTLTGDHKSHRMSGGDQPRQDVDQMMETFFF